MYQTCNFNFKLYYCQKLQNYILYTNDKYEIVHRIIHLYINMYNKFGIQNVCLHTIYTIYDQYLSRHIIYYVLYNNKKKVYNFPIGSVVKVFCLQ